jgi:hypothetical protein
MSLLIPTGDNDIFKSSDPSPDLTITFTQNTSDATAFLVERSQLISPHGKLRADWLTLPVVMQGIALLLEKHDKLDEDQVTKTRCPR